MFRILAGSRSASLGYGTGSKNEKCTGTPKRQPHIPWPFQHAPAYRRSLHRPEPWWRLRRPADPPFRYRQRRGDFSPPKYCDRDQFSKRPPPALTWIMRMHYIKKQHKICIAFQIFVCPVFQCFGSGSGWIRIQIARLDPDPENEIEL